MQRKVAEMKCGGTWEVFWEDGCPINPYKVVHKWREIDSENGGVKTKTKIMARKPSLQTAMWLLYYVAGGKL